MTSLPTAPFWMVYGAGQREPTRQHPSRSVAETEAKRLARTLPGTVFIVLEAVGAVVKDDLRTVRFVRAPVISEEPGDDEIPF